MRTDAELEKAVKEGAAIMDLERADWALRINKFTLNLASPNACVLGQEYGSYLDGMHTLGHTEAYQDVMEVDSDWARAHGFESEHIWTSDGTALTDEYDRLKELWVKEIEARRG